MPAIFQRWRLPSDDLLRHPIYRRMWTSVLTSSFGAQITMLALPLTAATVLHASPTQMGMLTAFEVLPFVLLSLPAGVWLDRMRKLPVYRWGEFLMAVFILSVPLAYASDRLSMGWLYAVGFSIGCIHVMAGSAAQIVLTQVVGRDRLVEAHAKNALATSAAEVTGPGMAGALIKAMGAPLALVFDALLILGSVFILKGVKVEEPKADRQAGAEFWLSLREGLKFVRSTPLLVTMAVFVGLWQMSHHAAVVVQILYATRELHLSERETGLAYVGMGLGTILGSVYGNRISSRMGPGPCMTLGFAITGLGWLAMACVPPQWSGLPLLAFMLWCFSAGATIIFINFLALRQAVTPSPLLGRMTSTMRWLILIPAGPGALLGGWLGEHVGLRVSLGFAGVLSVALALLAWRHPVIQAVRSVPKPVSLDEVQATEESDQRPALGQ